MPSGSCEDSVSFLPALSGEKIKTSRKGVVHHSFTGHFAYRMGKWKLLLAKASGGWTSPKENQVKAGALIAQLYNMDMDIGEQKNIYENENKIVSEMLSNLESDVRRGRSTDGPKSKNDISQIVLWKSGKKSKSKQ